MNGPARRDYLLLTGIAAVISVGALIFYYRQGALLLYGDAVAHINIARRVFDSRTPGLLQLGTVWLPLPHLLDVPFIVNDRLWRSGIGASVPSMIAYIAGTLGIFRLFRGWTPRLRPAIPAPLLRIDEDEQRVPASRAAGWIAALAFALNPSLIYMQATAMTESLYLALFIWATVYFSEFTRQAGSDGIAARKSLVKCGLLVSAGMLSRYDGWFLAAVIAVGALAVLWRLRAQSPDLRRGFAVFLLLTGATAVLFLTYNYFAFGSALEFATGPYSPHAIQERTKTPTMPTYPGENSPRDATLQFLKIARLNVAEGRSEKLLFIISFVALLAAIYFSRRFLPWAVLWTPVLFYVLCMAWGSVPVYQPDWWPFSYYNVRYGLQLLPAIAVFTALAYEFLARFFPAKAVAAVAMALVALSCFSSWSRTPVCVREAWANGTERMELERALAAEIGKLPPSATLMMDCSVHPGAVQLAGIHFRRILRESNPPYWEAALSQPPAQSADYVIAFPGDPVDQAVRRFPAGLRKVATVGTPRQTGAAIYRSMR